MNNESRNYLKDRRHISMTSIDVKNKSIDKLNQSKEIEKVSDRMSKFEILNQDKEQSFSHKGPVIVTDHMKLLSDEGISNKEEIGRKSEVVKPLHPNDFDLEEWVKTKSGDFLPFLENKTTESNRKSDKIDHERFNNLHNYNEFVSNPSEDKSNEHKSEIPEEINTSSSISEIKNISNNKIEKEILKDETIKESQAENTDRVEGTNKSKYEEMKQNYQANQKNDDDDWPSGFPSIADNKTVNHDEAKTERKIWSNYDLLNDIWKNPHNELDSLWDDYLLCNLSKEENMGDTGDKRIQGVEELFDSSNDKIDINRDSIIFDSKNINKQREEEIIEDKLSPFNDWEPPAFPIQESEINSMFSKNEVIKEDSVPSKPLEINTKKTIIPDTHQEEANGEL